MGGMSTCILCLLGMQAQTDVAVASLLARAGASTKYVCYDAEPAGSTAGKKRKGGGSGGKGGGGGPMGDDDSD